MKKLFYILPLCLSLAVVLPGCEKFLDKRPINLPTDTNFWNNEAEATSSVAGAYALLRTALSEKGMAYYYYGDFATDEFAANIPGEDLSSLGNIGWNFFIPSTETFRALIRMRSWDNFYRAIDQANRCIKFIPDIPLDKFTSANRQAAKDALVAEAYFLRAFNYFYMSRVWGDVPLVIETVEDAAKAPNLPRNPQAEVLAQCIKDLEVAIPKMVWAPQSASRAIRVSKGAAYALLAHIYAWQGDYAKVIPAADSVILKGGYTYVNRSTGASYLGIWRGNSSEGIFEIAKNATNEASAGTGIVDPNIAIKTLKSPYLATNLGNSILTLDAISLGALFPDAADHRRANGFAFWGTTDPITIKYSNIIYTGANNTSPLVLTNIIIFRLADIALLKAEALAATNNFGAARTLLDANRALSNAPASTALDNNLFEAIIEERARELFLEGHRFYDLIRLGKKTGILKFNGSGAVVRMDATQFEQEKYYWPIDPILIIANPQLQQTPYWRDKM